MRKRLFWALVLALALCMVLPATAFAKGTVSYTGIKSKYYVAKGKNLTVTGRAWGKPAPRDWRDHWPFEIEKWNGKRWVDVTDYVPVTKAGNLKIKLIKPSAGLYRMHYDGCKHYYAASKKFRIFSKNPVVVQPVAKLDPLLSVDIADYQYIQGLSTQALVDGFLIQGHIHTGQSAEKMTGVNLQVTALASLSGATYTPVYTVPGTLSFNGTQDTTPALLPVPWRDDNGNLFSYYKLRADWLGNEATNPGTAESQPLPSPN